jgi:hypothetical protein
MVLASLQVMHRHPDQRYRDDRFDRPSPQYGRGADRYGRDPSYRDPRDQDDLRYADRDRYRDDDDRRYGQERDFRGSEVLRDRERGYGPRYHGEGWDRVEREYDPRHPGRYSPDPLYGLDRRRAQGGDAPAIDRQSRRYGDAPIDDGERRRYHGGWNRDDDRSWTGRGMGGDTYGGQDRGYDSLIPPYGDERRRYDVGRFDQPDSYRGEDRWMRDRGDELRWGGGGSYGGEHAGMRRRR